LQNTTKNDAQYHKITKTSCTTNYKMYAIDISAIMYCMSDTLNTTAFTND